MRYVDGYVSPLPKKNLPAYRRMAQKAARPTTTDEKPPTPDGQDGP